MTTPPPSPEIFMAKSSVYSISASLVLPASFNWRFMACKRSREIILSADPIENFSHGQIHYDSGARGGFDNFVRGWVGRSPDEYPSGIIHFAPPLTEQWLQQDPKAFDSATCAIQFFCRSGFPGNVIIRGATWAGWEVPVGVAFPGLIDLPDFDLPRQLDID